MPDTVNPIVRARLTGAPFPLPSAPTVAEFDTAPTVPSAPPVPPTPPALPAPGIPTVAEFDAVPASSAAPTVAEFDAVPPSLAEFDATPAVAALDAFQQKSAAELAADRSFDPVQFKAACQNAYGALPDDLNEKLYKVEEARKDLPSPLRQTLESFVRVGTVATPYSLWKIGKETLAKGSFPTESAQQLAEDAATVADVVKGGWGVAKSLWRLSTGAGIGGTVAGPILRDWVSNGYIQPETVMKLIKMTGEDISSIDAGLQQGLAQATQISQALQEAPEAGLIPLGGRAPHVDTPEERRERIRTDFDVRVDQARQAAKTLQGKGPIMSWIGSWSGMTPEALKAAGIELDPQAIQDRTLLTNPINLIPFGAGFKVIGLGGRELAWISETALKNGLEAFGKLGTDLAAPAARKVVAGATVGGGAALGGTAGAVVGNAIAGPAGRLAQKLVEVPSQALIRNAPALAQRLEPAATGALTGAAIGIPFAAGAETKEQAAQTIGSTAFFGGFGALAHQATDATQQKIADAYRVGLTEALRTMDQSPPYAANETTEPTLDAINTQTMAAMQRTDPLAAGLINWVREKFRGLAEVYTVPEDVLIHRREVIDRLKTQFYGPGYAEEPAISELGKGVAGFKFEFPAGNGKPARTVCLLNAGVPGRAAAHEPGHYIMDALFDLVAPEAGEAFRAQVAHDIAPYETALNKVYHAEGLPGDTLNEACAETISAILRGRSLNGTPPGTLQTGLTFIGSALEKLGILSPPIDPKSFESWHGGLQPSFTARRLAEPVMRTLETPEIQARMQALNLRVAKTPEVLTTALSKTGTLSAAPAQPGAVPLKRPPGIAQEEFEARRGDEAAITEARNRILNHPTLSPEAKQEQLRIFDTIVNAHLRTSRPMAASVIYHGTQGAEGANRDDRRAEQRLVELQRKLGGEYPPELLEPFLREGFFDGVKVRGDNVNFRFKDLSIVLDNALRIAAHVAKTKRPDLFPADYGFPVDGKFTPEGFKLFADDLSNGLANQAHGYGIDGTPIVTPPGWQGVIPPPDPHWTPVFRNEKGAVMPQKIGQFLNAVLGMAPPKTGKVMPRPGRPGWGPAHLAAQQLAQAHGRPVEPAPLVPIKNRKTGEVLRMEAPVFKKEDLAKKGIIVPEDIPLLETNPYRNRLRESGFDPKKELQEFTREMSLEQIKGVTPKPNSLFSPPDVDLARSGFMAKAGDAVTLVGPNEERVPARYDGDQDASMLGLGMVRQITPQQDLPGYVRAHSTTYEPALNKHGWRIEETNAARGDYQQEAALAEKPGAIGKEAGESGTFMAKAGKEEPLDTSGWITPEGEYRSIAGTSPTHEAWLAANAEELNGKYGTKFSKTAGVSEREKAIRAGFVRVRYDNRAGELAVESGVKGWNQNARDLVFRIVHDNLDAIDNVRVNVVNDKMKVVRQGSAQLFEFDTDEEKLAHIPLVSESERGSFMAKATPQDRLVAASKPDAELDRLVNDPDVRLASAQRRLYLDEWERRQRAKEAPGETRAASFMSKPEKEDSITLIRHGDTKFNASGGGDAERVRGHQDVPLTKEGEQEADRVGKELANSGIRTIVTSDLKRAADTGDRVAAEIGVTGGKVNVLREPGLRPWKFGPTIEGHKVSEVLPQIRHLVENPDEAPPGGESFNSFKSRFFRTFEEVSSAHPENTAIVSHYRGDKLLEAWDAAGRNGYDVDPKIFLEQKGLKPGGYRDVRRSVEAPGAVMPEAGEPESRRERAQKFFVPATLEKQRQARGQEQIIAQAISGEPGGYRTPADILKAGLAVEVKTIVAGKNPKITMHPDSLARKQQFGEATGRRWATVVADLRQTPPVYYWREGIGSFRLPSMQSGSLQDLQKALVSPDLLKPISEAPKLQSQPKIERKTKLDTPPGLNDIEPMKKTKFMAKGPLANSERVAAELALVRAGKNGGQTFNADGTVWDRGETKPHIVSMTSINVPLAKLTPAVVQEVADKYAKALAIPGTALGVFKSQKNPGMASIDVNALPDQKYRENTLAFAKANDQEAVWDPVKQESIDTGGKGNTVLADPDEIAAAVKQLLRGKMPKIL